jgi:hypothetical protein
MTDAMKVKEALLPCEAWNTRAPSPAALDPVTPSSGNAPEPFAWLVLSEETGNTRLWSRNGDIAKTFAAKHGLECIALYRAAPASGNVLQIPPQSDLVAVMDDNWGLITDGLSKDDFFAAAAIGIRAYLRKRASGNAQEVDNK